jgi:hypothetical protein
VHSVLGTYIQEDINKLDGIWRRARKMIKEMEAVAYEEI